MKWMENWLDWRGPLLIHGKINLNCGTKIMLSSCCRRYVDDIKQLLLSMKEK